MRLLASLALGVLSVAVSAGCGGGQDDGKSAVVTVIGKEWSSTPERYAKHATERCIKHRQQMSADLAAFLGRRDRGERSASALAAEAMGRVLLPVFRAQYEELRELWPPSGDEDFLDLMLSTFSRSLEEGEEDLARFFRIKPSGYTEFGEATVMMREYDITGCGSYRHSPQAILLDFESTSSES